MKDTILKQQVKNISNELKFNMCLIFCIVVHATLILFGRFFEVKLVMYFNIFSVAVYMFLLTFMRKRQEMIYYFSFFEIIIHSFVCVIAVGHNFGFSLYFIMLVPISYNLLHSIHVKSFFLKASFGSLISFILYSVCYYVSEVSSPIYSSVALDYAAPYVYVLNVFLTFIILIAFSVLFIMETDTLFDAVNDKNKELEMLANTDTLTGLYNRRTMSDEIKNLYENYKKRDTVFSLVICDIDNFKKFNDTYGHDCGDVVLKSIAQKLSSLTRSSDYICRWGGEEFLILLNGSSIENAREIAERFRKNIEEMDLSYNGKSLHITMTFGVACAVETEEYNDLFKIADERLYEGKTGGKNCVR